MYHYFKKLWVTICHYLRDTKTSCKLPYAYYLCYRFTLLNENNVTCPPSLNMVVWGCFEKNQLQSLPCLWESNEKESLPSSKKAFCFSSECILRSCEFEPSKGQSTAKPCTSLNSCLVRIRGGALYRFQLQSLLLVLCQQGYIHILLLHFQWKTHSFLELGKENKV